MQKIVFLIYCIFLIFPRINTTDYCKICKNKSHTMCKYKSGPAKSCVNYNRTNMTPKIQNKIVELHNNLRREVALGNETRGDPGPQPQASNMFALRWDEELAIIAQRWADQCISVTQTQQHDECRKTDKFDVGQNIIETFGDQKSLDIPSFDKILSQMIMQWYIEVGAVNAARISKFQNPTYSNKTINHYSQLVWATTKYVGCAHVSFKDYLPDQNKSINLDRLVCNYGPNGNIPGAPIYKEGLACSDCESQCSKEYFGLCNDDEITTTVNEINEELETTPSAVHTRTVALDTTRHHNFHFIHNYTDTKPTETLVVSETTQLQLSSMPNHSVSNVTETESLDDVIKKKHNKPIVTMLLNYFFTSSITASNIVENITTTTIEHNNSNKTKLRSKHIEHTPKKETNETYSTVNNSSTRTNTKMQGKTIVNMQNAASFDNQTNTLPTIAIDSTTKGITNITMQSTRADTITFSFTEEVQYVDEKTIDTNTMEEDSDETQITSTKETISDFAFRGGFMLSETEDYLNGIETKAPLERGKKIQKNKPSNTKKNKTGASNARAGKTYENKEEQNEGDTPGDGCHANLEQRESYRMYHNDGDECYCLIRIKSCASKLFIEMYVISLRILLYFIFF